MEQQNAVGSQLPATQYEIETEEDEIDLIELLFYLADKWLYLFIGLLAGAILAGLITYFLITPKFTATSKLYMVSNSSDTIVDLSDFNIGNSLSSDYEELLRVRPILDQIIEEEDLPYKYEELRKMIDISTINNTRILQISANSPSPSEAMTIANALADKAVEEIPVLMDTAKPNIAERAIVPDKKSSPSMVKNVIIGALIGFLLIAAILIGSYLMDDTMSTAEDVNRKLGFMPLTVIPEGELQSRYNTEREAGNDKHRHHQSRSRRRDRSSDNPEKRSTKGGADQ
jgi:capsular polysaccharide biosynthesis protein